MTPGALVVGEALIDRVETDGRPTEDRPGGSAVNVAIALARLGRRTRLATSFAPDEHGRLLRAHLAGSEVAEAADPHVLARTSLARARIGADGSATYDFDVEWRLPVVDDVRAQVVHVCSLAPVLSPGATDVHALLDRLDTTVSYDINARPAITGSGRDVVAHVERTVARADIVKASDEDLAMLWPDARSDEVLDHLLDLGPVAVVETRGPAGCRWRVRTDRGLIGGDAVAPVASVVDTIGAGDTFGAGMLDGLWELLGPGGRERLAAAGPDVWRTALTHAMRCAAVTVGRVGADPPRRAELVD